LRIITVNLPETYLKAIDRLTGKDGLYPSRSELIRVAVRDWILKETQLLTKPSLLPSELIIPKQFVDDPNIISFDDGTVLTLKPREMSQ